MLFFRPIIPTITLISQIIIEYSTLKRRRTLCTDLLVRGISLLFVYGGYLLFNFIGIKDFFVYYLLTIAYFLACLYLFEESLAQKIFLYFAVWGMATFLSSLCNWIAIWLTNGGENELLIRYLLYFFCYLILIQLYLKFWRDRVKDILFLFEKGNPVYAAYPILAFVVFCVLFGPTSKTISPKWFVIMLLFEAIILFSYYILFSQFHAVYWRMQAETRLNNTERLVLLQKKYYEQVDKGTREQQKILHDTRHHLVAMTSFVKNEEYDTLEQYIQQLSQNYSDQRIRRFCRNSTTNAVIGGYIEIAEEKGISVSVEIDLPQDIGINKYELCTIFGNTIENAIEACERIATSSELYEKRYISIKSKVEKEHLIIRIENTCDSNINRNKETLLSSKGSLGGVGLKNVKNVVEQYNGCLSCENNDNIFIFSAVLCVKLSGELDLP